MKNITALLDAVKAAKNLETDYALAKELGAHRQLISAFYKGTRTPDNTMCLEIAKRIGQPLDKVIAAVEVDAEKDEQRREEWRRYYKSIGGIAASVAIMIFTSCILIVTPTPAEASTLQALNPYHFVLC